MLTPRLCGTINPTSRGLRQAKEQVIEIPRNDYTVSTNRSRLNLSFVHSYLSRTSYWAQGRSWDVVRKSIENSLCFGLYLSQAQIGFARVVTDYATFAWLCDVFVIEAHQGQGLGKWLIESVVAHPALKSLDIFILATTDAHELYRRYGNFSELQQPRKWMTRSPEPGHS